MKRFWKVVTWLFIVLLLVLGLFLVFHKQVETWLVSNETKQVLEQPAKKSTKKPTYKYDDIKPVGLSDVVKERKNTEDVNRAGKIAIPSVNILLPIVEGVTNQSLSVGAGTMKPNQEMGKGNYALASHNMNDYKTLFSPLLNIKTGAKIYLTNGSKTFVYQVDRKEYIDPSHVEVIDDEKGKNEITLITCSMDGNQRLLVQGKLISEMNGESSEFKTAS